jgi:hypothetical protein
MALADLGCMASCNMPCVAAPIDRSSKWQMKWAYSLRPLSKFGTVLAMLVQMHTNKAAAPEALTEQLSHATLQL